MFFFLTVNVDVFLDFFSALTIFSVYSANEGHLYPLEKQFIFIHKPAVLIRFEEVESVEFQRYAGGQGSTRNFDLCVTLLNTPGDNLTTKEYIFSGIDKTNYAALYSFLSGKKIRIKNIEGVDGAEEKSSSREGGTSMYDETEGGGMGADDMDESSEDEDYDQDNRSEGDESSESDSEDDDDLGSVVSDDSDLAEHRKEAMKKSKGKEKSKKSSLEESKGKSASKKRKEVSVKPGSPKKKKKKDPNAPKKGRTGEQRGI